MYSKRVKDITGQRFGRLVAVRYEGTDKNGFALWMCRCDCGRTKIIKGYRLRSQRTHSCGCLNSPVKTGTGNVNYKHGGSSSRLYTIWQNMKQRCGNPKATEFSAYGGRGIKVSPEWESDFAVFREWAIAHGYADNLTIDRIDNDKGYFPDNCQWLTRSENSMKHY